MKNCNCKYITDYINMIDGGCQQFCKQQKQLSVMTKRVFENEDIYVDCEQAERYFEYQKYFPYKLFAWEKFAFVMHNCVYHANGFLRFPTLILFVGRGAGKNGYLTFENFSLLTPTNGVKDYHIDTFALSEDQAKTTFEEFYDILESNPRFFKNYFYWNKEYIRNLQTGSKYRFRTSNFKTKDSGRQGKVDFDEVHMMEDDKLIRVGTSGLGKKKHPRRTFLSTDGYVREGPLDDLKEKCEQILAGVIEDNGTLPMIFKLDVLQDVHNPENWTKANPSLPHMPILLEEIEREYKDYLLDPIRNSDFITKRMNAPQGLPEFEVTTNENLMKTDAELLPITGKNAILCFDYAASRDFAAVGIITSHDDKLQFQGKMFVLKNGKDLPRIHAPLDEWNKKELIEFVDGVDIPPERLIEWAAEMQITHSLTYEGAALDYFRYSILKRHLESMGFVGGRDGNLKLVRPSDIMIALPAICSDFDNGNLICGHNPAFRWCVRNVKKVLGDKHGNEIFEKIEPKSRKTDLFMAYVAGRTISDRLLGQNETDVWMPPPIIL